MEQKENLESILPEHRKAVEGIRKKYGHTLSAHAFNSLYLWRREMELSLLLEEDMFTVKCGWKGKNCWFFPCGGRERVLEFLKRHETEETFSLCYMREQDRELLESCFPGKYEIREAADSYEYLCEREGHMLLQGKTYANVRTQLHKIEREHRLSVQPLGRENMKAALEIVGGWKGKAIDALNPASVDLEGLENREAMGITGVLVYVDGEPCSIAAGYPITNDTYDLYLAKEKMRIPGLSYYTKREFFFALPEQYHYLNIEEDLGIEGIRLEKRKLGIAKMNRIWEAQKLSER